MSISNIISDKDLAEACAKKNNAACELLYNSQVEYIYFLCFKSVKDYELARDLEIECFCKVFDNIKRYNTEKGSLTTWIRSVSLNVIKDYFRKRNKDIQEVLADYEEEAEEENIIPDYVLKEMVDKLPSIQKRIIKMFYYEGKDYKTIAQMLGIKVNAATSMASKAKKSLLKMINNYLKR